MKSKPEIAPVAKLFKNIHKPKYFQARQNPTLGHPHYLHLADLKLAITSVANEENGNWLDYAPYQFLFYG